MRHVNKSWIPVPDRSNRRFPDFIIFNCSVSRDSIPDHCVHRFPSIRSLHASIFLFRIASNSGTSYTVRHIHKVIRAFEVTTPNKTRSLSHSPSPAHSVHPFIHPPIHPSARPSVHPLTRPSYHLTIVPSYNPTILPSYHPTILPS